MSDFNSTRRKFSNNRQWRDFVAAVHESVTYPCTVTYPMILSTLRSASASIWFSERVIEDEIIQPEAG